MIDRALTDDPKKAGIPPFLQVQNRRVLTAEEHARVNAWLAKPSTASAALGHDEWLARLQAGRARDAAVAATLMVDKKQQSLDGLRSRTAAARERIEREGKHVPGCIWNAAAGRWAHPAAVRDGTRWISKSADAGTTGATDMTTKNAKKNGKKSALKVRGPAKKTTNGGSKTEAAGKLLARSGGCTSADILEATGWPSVSVPAVAKACGLKLSTEKEKGKPTRYYGA